ncbi:spermidine/putrescine ABC transporter substrate-binding protein [Frondihabitans sp. PAMC 28766]|uniref:spermidine/putrescine ABC transporter substrate-binding protein n=1 Tax=Frondihabitans sp. PAMC 28766 TaxID=1795630 RepID=UPI00078CD8CE|nr:spermidine/putrescine ABC transporter substrate-binding protein [Frondihabitans sp. PAMC 28766]AMM20343.1 spermidine/putrescine ABC transporter substrate-binding protein [Frondihabitans sp. PAMC 28766]
MADSIEGRVRVGVDAFLRWLPRWEIGTSRGRTRVCRLCLGSPVATAAGFDHDVPHAVQHALLSRMRVIVDDAVDEYTARNLPMVSRELAKSQAQDATGYRPDEGLALEFQGLQTDPEPEPGQPFLFTLKELADEDEKRAAETDAPRDPEPPTVFTEEAKNALRTELELADDQARQVGTAVCFALMEHRQRIADAIDRLVEPQVDELLAELSKALENPRSRS